MGVTVERYEIMCHFAKSCAGLREFRVFFDGIQETLRYFELSLCPIEPAISLFFLVFD